MKTNDRKITDLMSTIHTGKTQLPDFQRGWVWDDSRIKALIASITNGYPVGAAMFLEYGNESIHFKSRVVEGAPSADKVTPDELILDGQQRLTSVYSSLFSEKAVRTKTDKGQEIERFYYIDMVKAVNSTIDRVDSIVSVPKDRKITSDFGRKIELDLSSASQEYAQNMFPLNIILDPSKYSKWQMDYMQYHQYDPNAAKLYMDFLSKVIVPLGQYTIPVITLDKDTPKEAVCQVFENVNTGGVSLTVFELVTAIFAMDNFELRKDWEERQKKYFEVGSCSNLGDAQARRLKIRVNGENGKYFAHTLNNTVVAPPRMLIAFLENNLQADGSVKIPEVLQPYMGGMKVIEKK
jgi:hypothetical protein